MATRNARQRAHDFGMIAEYVAIAVLFFKGYRILKHRYKTPVGEIDVIARKKNVLVAVEIKFRAGVNNPQSILESITPQSRVRIARALQCFVQAFPAYAEDCFRFDAITLSWPPRFHHLDNAWLPRA